MDSVELSLQRTSDGAWWNGSAFVTGAQIWLPTTGTASWSYAFSPSVGNYALQARAADAAHNQTIGAVVTFTRRRF